jgi:hypothetical protein
MEHDRARARPTDPRLLASAEIVLVPAKDLSMYALEDYTSRGM